MAQTFQIGLPYAFCFSKPNEWPKWIRRFERFRSALTLDEKADAVQVNTIIYAMGDEADDIVAGFGLTNEERNAYAVVKSKFDEHFVVRGNAIFERAMFNRRSQEEAEMVDTFINALFCLAEHCEYGALNDEMIRDRIVVGITDAALSLKLQMNSTLTLKKAIDMARQNEAAKKEQALLRNNFAAKTYGNVDFVRTRKSYKPGQSKEKTKAQPKSTSTRKCDCCGKSPAHQKSVCPAQHASSTRKSDILGLYAGQRDL